MIIPSGNLSGIDEWKKMLYYWSYLPARMGFLTCEFAPAISGKAFKGLYKQRGDLFPFNTIILNLTI